MPVNRDYPTKVPKDAYFDNCKRMASGDGTTKASENGKVGPDGIVLEKVKIGSPSQQPMAPAIGHMKK